MLSKPFSFFILLLVSFSFAGCHPEEKITRATRPRVNDFKRLLAAIVLPEKDKEEQKTWFFTTIGLESEIDGLLEPFNQFLKSIQFTTPDNPTWSNLPQGWSEEKDKNNKNRYATIYTGPKGKAPELTVIALRGEKAASVPDKVNDWRGQLGLKGLHESDLRDFFRPEIVGGRPAIVVDMIGPGGKTPMVLLPEPEAPQLPFTFKIPPGWKEIPPTSQFYVLSLIVVDKDKKADCNVSVLPGEGGGLLLNVNRWRKQLGLDELPPEKLNALPEVSIGGAKGKLIDIIGPNAPPKKNRILGAIVIRANDSLFFKMMGPDDFVGKQKPAFETFLKSIHFDR